MRQGGAFDSLSPPRLRLWDLLNPTLRELHFLLSSATLPLKMPPIAGVNKTTLWNTWKIIRAEIRNGTVRDVIDFVDYDVDPDVWIKRLLGQIASGRYEPATPFRFTIGKSNGFSRTMTQPGIPDLVLYRTIVDTLYRKALRREHTHVYFKRERLQQAQNTAQQQAAQKVQWAGQYRMTSERSFYNWLRYAQYRKHLLLQAVHPFLVVTDVTNFFDSLLHSHVEEALRGIAVAPRMLGLLFFLLERLSIRQDYASSHAISLPVDEFDCSRTLAHMTLFTHDDAMVALVGEANYVRWMDDQNFGVPTKAEGLRVQSEVGKSLAKLHLSPNTKKSRILSLSEARRHFHLDLNHMLDAAEATAKAMRTQRDRSALARQLRTIWIRAQVHDGIGEFEKVLRRLYRLAGVARARFLRRRAPSDILSDPGLAERISDYVRASGTAAEYLAFERQVKTHPEQVYPDVDLALTEGLLRIEGDNLIANQIRANAATLLAGKQRSTRSQMSTLLAPLLLLRFGDRRSLPSLKRCFDDEKLSSPPPLLRASAIVYASYGVPEFRIVRQSAARWMRNELATVVKLIERIRKYDDVPDRYKSRLKPRFDPVAGIKYVDLRSLLTIRLLHISAAPRVTRWVSNWKSNILSDAVSQFDKALVRRLL